MSVLTNKIGKGYVLVSMGISAAVVFLIMLVLLINSWDAVSTIGWDMFSLSWNPAKGEYGILSMGYGTVVVAFVAMVLAVPIGLLSAIFTSEFLSVKHRFIVKSLLELLAGIPSIVIGLIGVAFFSLWIQDGFGLQTGRTLFTGGILLSIMILPTIITLADDAIRNVPEKYRENALGLGLYKYEILKDVVLPIAKPDIITAILLAFGRAMGETMAVMLVVGSIDRIPSPVYNWLTPGQTVTSKLGREMAESSFGSLHFSAMIFMGLLLMGIVMMITTIAQRNYKPDVRIYE